MIEEQGVVVAVDHSGVWVETVRQSTCGSCSARKGCGQNLLARAGYSARNRVRVLCSQPVQVGDEVVIGIPETVFLQASLLVYLLPLALLFVGALAAEWLVATPDGELATVAGGLIGLLAGFGWVRRHARCHRDNDRFQPTLLRRVGAAVIARSV